MSRVCSLATAAKAAPGRFQRATSDVPLGPCRLSGGRPWSSTNVLSGCEKQEVVDVGGVGGGGRSREVERLRRGRLLAASEYAPRMTAGTKSDVVAPTLPSNAVTEESHLHCHAV
jgi:hypothetical protein